MFEITILVGACFIVNYVTADAKTNWAEGMMMVAFYFMIVRVLGFLLDERLHCHRRSRRGGIKVNRR